MASSTRISFSILAELLGGIEKAPEELRVF